MKGADESSFLFISGPSGSYYFEEIISNATNVSITSVESAFVGMLQSTQKRDLSMYEALTNFYTRSNDDIALITVYFTNINIDEEIVILRKVNDTEALLSDINQGLKDMPELPQQNMTLISIGEITRRIGNFLYQNLSIINNLIKVYQGKYYNCC